jgi:hypothetical protein
MTIQRYREALVKFERARDAFYDAIVAAFPVGTWVYYRHGARERSGKVTGYVQFNHVKLQTSRGKVVCVHAPRIMFKRIY